MTQSLRTVWRLDNGNLVCVSDDILYRSTDGGDTWDKLADSGKWSTAVDSRGIRHWTWVEWDNTYPTQA